MLKPFEAMEHPWKREGYVDHRSSYLSGLFSKEQPKTFDLEDNKLDLQERDQEFQTAVAILVKDFNPGMDPRSPEHFSYQNFAALFEGSTIEEMGQTFAYSFEQKKALTDLLHTTISVPFEKVFRDPSAREDYDRARKFNVGYVAGVIEREMFRLSEEDIQRKEKNLAYLSPEDARRLITSETETLRKSRERLRAVVNQALLLEGTAAEKIEMIVRFLGVMYPVDEIRLDEIQKKLEKDSYLLDDLSTKDEVMIDMNRAGDFATEATIAFYQNLFGVDAQKAQYELQALLNAPDYLLQKWATRPDTNNPDEMRRSQMIFFAVRAANFAWIYSKAYQGFSEQHAVWQKTEGDVEAKGQAVEAFNSAKPGKGEGRYTRGEGRNKYFTTFDNMSTDKGWPAVLLDVDQIRTGLRIRTGRA